MSMRLISLLALLASPLLGCSTAERESSVEKTGTTEHTVSRSDSLRFLIQGLRTLDGMFVQGSDSSWTFTPESPLFAEIARFGDRAVSELVACIDDIRPARATIDGRQVYTGVMCYEVLRRFIYYEHWDPEIKGYSPDWAGYLTPTAAPAELRTAKRLWLTVLRNRSYRFG